MPEIVRDTCGAIWECLKQACMSARDKMTGYAQPMNSTRTTFPNCIGAVDGKHIRMTKPNESGSQFFNYKKFYSTVLVLVVVVDADCCSIPVEVGA